MEDASNSWSSVSLTHIQYPTGDVIGYVLAWASLLPIFIFVSISTLILFRRDLHTICMGIGVLLNEALNKILKRLIADERPLVPGRHNHHGYGMPSDHSQYMAFFSLYCLLFLYFRTHRTDTIIGKFWKVSMGTTVVAAAAFCCYSRYYLLYHTAMQVYGGILVGLFSGLIWFICVHLIFTPHFSYITSWKVCEFLLIRDYTLIPNTLWFEYCQVRTEARARMRKQNTRNQ
ncbi:dolichyldiphosphatase 1-like [Watersipora subatra]|uniref:dolichyldiphosphatase 1-like n=1 Tax=Watersipora subatra TaxID=2589382 RepID=UPI00355BF367